MRDSREWLQYTLSLCVPMRERAEGDEEEQGSTGCAARKEGGSTQSIPQGRSGAGKRPQPVRAAERRTPRPLGAEALAARPQSAAARRRGPLVTGALWLTDAFPAKGLARQRARQRAAHARGRRVARAHIIEMLAMRGECRTQGGRVRAQVRVCPAAHCSSRHRRCTYSSAQPRLGACARARRMHVCGCHAAGRAGRGLA